MERTDLNHLPLLEADCTSGSTEPSDFGIDGFHGCLGLPTPTRDHNHRRTRTNLLRNPAALGTLLESFVYNELRKQALWVEEPLSFHHYRDKDKVEVDLVMEDGAGDCYAVEVKARASLRAQDFAGLRRLRRIAGERFRIGVLLYDGDHATSFGDKLFAVPVGALWS